LPQGHPKPKPEAEAEAEAEAEISGSAEPCSAGQTMTKPTLGRPDNDEADARQARQ
jgi:hypothetical protein